MDCADSSRPRRTPVVRPGHPPAACGASWHPGRLASDGGLSSRRPCCRPMPRGPRPTAHDRSGTLPGAGLRRDARVQGRAAGRASELARCRAQAPLVSANFLSARGIHARRARRGEAQRRAAGRGRARGGRARAAASGAAVGGARASPPRQRAARTCRALVDAVPVVQVLPRAVAVRLVLDALCARLILLPRRDARGVAVLFDLLRRILRWIRHVHDVRAVVARLTHCRPTRQSTR